MMTDSRDALETAVDRTGTLQAEIDAATKPLHAEIERLAAALKPFGQNANATSLSEALGHITREHLLAARAVLARAATTPNSV